LAAFVGFAHGGALLLARAHPAPNAPNIESIATVSLPLAAFVFLTAVLGLVVRRVCPIVLASHGVLFLVGAVVLLVWGIGLLIYGIPTDVHFSWSPGFFTVIVAYAVYVFTRHTLPAKVRAWSAIFYAPLVALIAAAGVDIGVFVRFTHEVASHFAG
jgi:hypothetical protein